MVHPDCLTAPERAAVSAAAAEPVKVTVMVPVPETEMVRAGEMETVMATAMAPVTETAVRLRLRVRSV